MCDLAPSPGGAGVSRLGDAHDPLLYIEPRWLDAWKVKLARPDPPAGAFVRSAVTSVLATGSDFVVASGLVLLALPATLATFIGCAAGGLVAFSMNRGWAFRSRGQALPELVRFVLVWAGSALLNSAGVGAALRFGVGFSLTWASVRALVYSCWNYPMLRFFVFQRAR